MALTPFVACGEFVFLVLISAFICIQPEKDLKKMFRKWDKLVFGGTNLNLYLVAFPLYFVDLIMIDRIWPIVELEM